MLKGLRWEHKQAHMVLKEYDRHLSRRQFMKNIVVTAALPYANYRLHLGHLDRHTFLQTSMFDTNG